MILMFPNFAAFIFDLLVFLTMSFDGEFAGCKLVGWYFYMDGLGYCFLAAAIFSEFIVKLLKVIQNCWHLIVGRY